MAVLLAIVPVPSVVMPSLKVTVPVGFTPLTVAVIVTACPATDGLGVVVIEVVLVATFTVWLTAVDVLVALFASPAYTAVKLCAPAVVKV